MCEWSNMAVCRPSFLRCTTRTTFSSLSRRRRPPAAVVCKQRGRLTFVGALGAVEAAAGSVWRWSPLASGPVDGAAGHFAEALVHPEVVGHHLRRRAKWRQRFLQLRLERVFRHVLDSISCALCKLLVTLQVSSTLQRNRARNLVYFEGKTFCSSPIGPRTLNVETEALCCEKNTPAPNEEKRRQNAYA